MFIPFGVFFGYKELHVRSSCQITLVNLIMKIGCV